MSAGAPERINDIDRIIVVLVCVVVFIVGFELGNWNQRVALRRQLTEGMQPLLDSTNHVYWMKK